MYLFFFITRYVLKAYRGQSKKDKNSIVVELLDDQRTKSKVYLSKEEFAVEWDSTEMADRIWNGKPWYYKDITFKGEFRQDRVLNIIEKHENGNGTTSFLVEYASPYPRVYELLDSSLLECTGLLNATVFTVTREYPDGSICYEGRTKLNRLPLGSPLHRCQNLKCPDAGLFDESEDCLLYCLTKLMKILLGFQMQAGAIKELKEELNIKTNRGAPNRISRAAEIGRQYGLLIERVKFSQRNKDFLLNKNNGYYMATVTEDKYTAAQHCIVVNCNTSTKRVYDLAPAFVRLDRSGTVLVFDVWSVNVRKTKKK